MPRTGFFVLLALGALLARPGAPAAAALEAGVARIDLTPPLSMKAALGGYGERMSRPATGVHDRIWAKALALRDGAARRVIVTADVLAFPPGLRQAVADALAQEGWQADQILLLPSHSHTSFDLTALNPRNTFQIAPLGLYHPELHDWTVAHLAQVIRQAARETTPVRVGTGVTRLEGWSRNRRGGQATDPDLTLTRIDSAGGKPLAVLVNWSAHPTFLDARHMEFSGDWPGHLQRTLEALIGPEAMALYYNGAEGDQSPTPRVADAPAWEQAERYGRDLAIEAWRLWQRIRPRPNPAFFWRVEAVDLPPRVAHPDFMKTGGAEYGLNADNIGALLERLCPERTFCTAVRLGDLIIAGVPGEMAAGLGLDVKAAVRRQSGVPHIAIGGLASEWISYLLAPDEYRRGGYEASVSFYGETLGPILVRAAVHAASLR